MRNGKKAISALTTEERLPESLPTESGATRYGTRGKAVAGTPTFQRPSFTDPWSGQTYPWTPYTNMRERQVIIMPRFAYEIHTTALKGISLRGVIQDSGITQLDGFVEAIDWFWNDIYTRLAFQSLQQGKRIAAPALADHTKMRLLFERWLFVAIGMYGIKSLWDANPTIPAVATWKKSTLTNIVGSESTIKMLFDQIHAFPVPQAFVDLAAYYGVGVAADTTGPVFVGLTVGPDTSKYNTLKYIAQGNTIAGLTPYLEDMRLWIESLTSAGGDDWNIWQILSLMYPLPTARPTTWRTDPEAVRLLLSEAVVRTEGGVTWLSNPRENSTSTLPSMVPIHGKSLYAATLFRPQFMVGTGLSTPDWAWGSLGSVPWENAPATPTNRESRLLVLPNTPGFPLPEWLTPDSAVDQDSTSNPWNQFLWGPPTIDDQDLTDVQVMGHHRFQDEAIAYISRQDIVLNTVALLERFFMGTKAPRGATKV